MASPYRICGMRGYAPSLPTPFDGAGEIDVVALERFCERQINAGSGALLVCGTTGEAPNLSRDEHDRVVRAAVNVARGKIPVIAGTGSNSTTQAIELTRDAEAAGADAVLSVVPYYNKPTQAGMYAHFCAIADQTSLPIMLHDVPARTVCGLAQDTVARLAKRPQFVGLLDEGGALARLLRLRALLGPQFLLLCADDATALAAFAQGADGCISVAANVAPGLCRAIHLAWEQGQIARARELAAMAGTLSAALARESDPAPLKYALSAMRMMSPHPRLPLVAPTLETKAAIDAVLAEISESYPGYLIGDVMRGYADRIRHEGEARGRRNLAVAS